MEVKILSKNEKEIRFLLEEVSSTFANSLRRIVFGEVPTMAIEWVDFYRNDSALWDEIIAHRLGLIPLTFDPKFFVLPERCSCGGKGCVHCQVKLRLNKKGPCWVHSGDLISEEESVKPVYDKIPITYLQEDEELVLEATAQLGLGKEHAKWQAGCVGFKHLAEIHIDGKVCDLCGKCVEVCPKKVFKLDSKVKVEAPSACDFCEQCMEYCPKKAIKVEKKPNDFVFYVESVCGLKVHEILKTAGKMLYEKVKSFEEKITELAGVAKPGQRRGT